MRLACLLLVAPLLTGCIGWTSMNDERIAELEAWDPAPVTTEVVLILVQDVTVGDFEEKARVRHGRVKLRGEGKAELLRLSRVLFPKQVQLSDVPTPADRRRRGGLNHYLVQLVLSGSSGVAEGTKAGWRFAGKVGLRTFLVGLSVTLPVVPVYLEDGYSCSAVVYDERGRKLFAVGGEADSRLLVWPPLFFLMVTPWEYWEARELAIRSCLLALSRHPLWSGEWKRPPEPQEDRHEPNDRLEDATVVKPATRYNQLRAASDDWYRVNLQAGKLLDVTIRFDHDVDDLDLELRDVSNNVLAASQTYEDTEHVRYRATETGSVYIRVKPNRRVGAEYVLEVR